MAAPTVRAPALNCEEAIITIHIYIERVPLALPLRQHYRTLEERKSSRWSAVKEICEEL